MKKCVSCGEGIGDSVTNCSFCGKEQPLNYRCRECGAPLELATDQCRKCGGEAESIKPYTKPTKFTFGIGAKLWFSVCIVSNILGFFGSSSFKMQINFAGLGISIIYIWLLLEKKWYIFRILIAYWVIILCISFACNLGIYPIAALLNVLITYLCIRKYWYEMQ